MVKYGFNMSEILFVTGIGPVILESDPSLPAVMPAPFNEATEIELYSAPFTVSTPDDVRHREYPEACESCPLNAWPNPNAAARRGVECWAADEKSGMPTPTNHHEYTAAINIFPWALKGDYAGHCGIKVNTRTTPPTISSTPRRKTR